ncbi:MAG: gluconokinase [Chloroflexota bacterium]
MRKQQSMSILVIDIGSSSVRAMLFDDHAEPMPNADSQRKHQFEYGQDGAVTANPQHLQTLVEDCISELLTKTRDPIDAVGISCFVGNLMGLDNTGTPITPLYTYADTRSQQHVNAITLDVNASYHRTGCRLHSAYNTLKLYWLKQTQAGLVSQVDCWLDFASYLYLQWFSETLTSYSIASWSGLLNREHLTWDEIWLNLLELNSSRLPQLADVDDTLQGLQSPYSEKWSALADVPFYLAIGDGAGANLGSGAVDSNYAALSVGSTSALRTISQATLPTIPDGLWSYRVTASQHLIGGATTEGGTAFAWARDILSLTDDDLAELSSRPADSHGLTILPLFAGERSPNWRGNAKATLHGLSLSTSKLDIVQAVLESVALRIASIADMLLADDVTIMASGGAITASSVWAQMMANAMNRPLNIITGETSARGIAVLVLSHLHGTQWSDYMPTVQAHITPQAYAVDTLQIARDRQQSLYQMLYQS